MPTSATAARRPTSPGAQAGTVRVGIGGWTYADWRDNFYPAGLPHDRELGYASRQLTAIEVNGTYYRTQAPATFAKWRDETPEGFVFALKAPRVATNRRVLAEAGPSIERFVGSGIAELGDKLGPILWQFAPTKRFDPEELDAFLALLPPRVGERPLRHVLEVRHPSFMAPEYLSLARRHGAVTVFTDSTQHPSFADATGGFVYARLMGAQADQPEGYAPRDLERWAEVARRWARGEAPPELPRVEPPAADATPAEPRDVFVFFIDGAKERAPAAAMSLLRRLRA